MKHWKKGCAVLTAAGMLVMTALTGCQSIDNDEVVATVGDTEISYGIANFYARMSQAQYETYYARLLGTTGEEMWKQEVEEGKTYEENLKENVMEALENLYILRQHAGDYEVALTEEDQKEIEEAATKFDEDNSLEDKEVVSGYGKYVKEYLELVTIQSKMEAPMKEGVNEEVADEEAAQKGMKYVYFRYTKTDEEGNNEDMTDEEKEDLKKTAEEFAKKLKDSEEKDIDGAAQEAGLEVQTVTFDAESTSPNEELIKAADALEEGETTDAIESDYGIYVGKVTTLLDREATDAEKKNIVEERKQEQYDKLVEKWREETEITVDEKIWGKLEFQSQGVTILESGDAYDDAGTPAKTE